MKAYASASTPLKKGKPLKTKRKATGELEVFKMIWEERPHICQVSGRQLTKDTVHFSHILPKGAFPRYRLLKENIWLVHHEIHDEWERGSRSQPKFAQKLAKYEELKIRYERERQQR